MSRDLPAPPQGSLAVTALYTAGAWTWARFPGAELYATPASRRVFGVVNLVLGIARWVSWSRASLRHDLVHRHALLDRVVRRAGPVAVLELAAGLSPRGAAFTAEDGPTWVEVDLPEMVAYKTALLQHTEAGRAVLARPHLRRVAADVSVTPLDELLVPEGPAVVLAEGLLMYLDAAAQEDLFARVGAWLARHGGTFAFDLVPPREKPDAGWVGRLLGGWMRRATGGGEIVVDPRDRGDLAAALRAAGFSSVEIVAPSVVATAWGLPFPGRKTEQLVWIATRGPAA